jgi:hypothetical protein
MNPILKKLRCILAILLAPLGLATPLAAATFGNFGERLDQAKQTEFFHWFHLEQTDVTRTDGNALISFKPSGQKFHDLVTVKVTTDAGGRILAVEMALARAFIDAPQDGIFARDIAKSFLLTELPAPRDREITDLINEIEHQGASTMTILKRGGNEPKLPEKPTPGYLTYLGNQPSYEHRLPGLLLRLENGKDALAFSLRGQ